MSADDGRVTGVRESLMGSGLCSLVFSASCRNRGPTPFLQLAEKTNDQRPDPIKLLRQRYVQIARGHVHVDERLAPPIRVPRVAADAIVLAVFPPRRAVGTPPVAHARGRALGVPARAGRGAPVGARSGSPGRPRGCRLPRGRRRPSHTGARRRISRGRRVRNPRRIGYNPALFAVPGELAGRRCRLTDPFALNRRRPAPGQERRKNPT